MDELIITRKIANLEEIIPMERQEFYENEIKRGDAGKEPKTAVDIVDVFIFNEHKELFIQKRSKEKTHNANLMDKSLGGHVQYEDNPNYTVMVETVQELQVPSITVYSAKEFTKTLKTLDEYLATVAVVKPVDQKLFVLDKIINNKTYRIANYVHLYFGLYNGRMKTVDREAKGILQYTLEDLYNEIEAFPKMFTDDLKVFLKEYKTEMHEFLKSI